MKHALFATLAAVVLCTGCHSAGKKNASCEPCSQETACRAPGEYGPSDTPGYGKPKICGDQHHKKVCRGGLLEHCYHMQHKPCHHCGPGLGAQAQTPCQPAPGPSAGAVAYPYYTTRGPRDFLVDNPPSIGPY